jgi:hypothetical protein
MSDFITRLETEKNELFEKLQKLDAFLQSDKIQSVDPIQLSLLQIQFAAMSTYLLCLSERWSRLTGKKDTIQTEQKP